MAVKFFFEGIVPAEDNPKILRQGIDSTSGTTDSSKVVVTDADGLIDPSFLTERVQDIVGDNLVTDTTSITWTYTDAAGTLEADVNDEYVQDTVGAMLTDSDTIDFTYDDGAGTLTAIVKTDSIDDTHIDWGTGANQVNTDDMPEGSTNLYFTDERSQDAVGGILTDTAEINFTYDDATPTITADIVVGSIDETKLDASVNASLDLADSALQLTDAPGSDGDVLINDSGSFGSGQYLRYSYSAPFHTFESGPCVLYGYTGIDTNVVELQSESGSVSGSLLQNAKSSSDVLQGKWTVSDSVDTQVLKHYSDGTFTYNDNTIWHAGNDGTGSGLDADTVDGYEATALLSRSNHSGTQTLSTISDAGTAASKDIGTSGATIPLLNTSATWSAKQTFSTDTYMQNLGLGVSTPETRLHIYGSGSTLPRILFENADASSGDRWFFDVSDGGDFRISEDGSGTQELIITDTTGYVGMGATGASPPVCKLDVRGDIKSLPTTVASLATGSAGMRSFVTDATTTTFGSVVTGGGSNSVPVYHDGTNWRIG